MFISEQISNLERKIPYGLLTIYIILKLKPKKIEKDFEIPNIKKLKPLKDLQTIQQIISENKSLQNLKQCIQNIQNEGRINLVLHFQGFQRGYIVDYNFVDAQIQSLSFDEDKAERKQLQGVTLAVKDQLKIKGFKSTLGFKFRENLPLNDESCIFVKILQDHGCIPLCTTSVPQGLFGLECTNNVNGISLNPYNLLFGIGGSSGGVCATIAINGANIGIASDSAGSIRIPASINGVFGFKPTGKRISKNGRFGFSGGLKDAFKEFEPSIGPVSNNIEDMIQVMKIVYDKMHLYDVDVPPMKFDQQLFDSDIKKLKIGYFYDTKMWKSQPPISNVINEVVQKLQSEGYEVVPFEFEQLDEFTSLILGMLRTPGVQIGINSKLENDKLMSYHQLYYQYAGFMPQLFKKIILAYYNKREKRWAKILENTILGDKLQLKDFYGKVVQKETLKDQFKQKIKEQGIDVLINPVLPFVGVLHGQGGYFLNMLSMCIYQNILDMPSGTVPIRKVKKEETYTYDDNHNDIFTQELRKNLQQSEGLPVSIQVTAAIWKDEIVLKFMQEIDKMFKFNKFQNM